MSREEYLEKIRELEKERINLKRDYILEHAPYPINSIVEVIDNRTDALLVRGVITKYFVFSIYGYINVAIHKITKKGKIANNCPRIYKIDDPNIRIVRVD